MRATRIGVVGAGILGLAVARRLTWAAPEATVIVVDKEDRVAAHQSGRNSGVVHAGIYYAPESLRARLCRRGVEVLRESCAERRLPFEECGKTVVALDDTEVARLRAIEQRARANGVAGLRWLDADGLREVEPNAGRRSRGQASGGLRAPTGGLGLHEFRCSLSKQAYAAQARRYVPSLDPDALLPAQAGIRAQAVDVDGSLVDDFRITRIGRVVAVRNTPSPGATSSLAIAEYVFDVLLEGAPFG